MHHQSQHHAAEMRGSESRATGQTRGANQGQGGQRSGQFQSTTQQASQPGTAGQHRPSTQSGGGTAQGGGTRFATRNYLAEDVRTATCQHLNQVLADTTALRTQARYAHWNVKGMQFYPLHELFEELAEELAEQEDLVAERITALGGRANATLHSAASQTRVGQISPETVTGRGFVQELADCLATHDANLYQDIRAAEEYDDLDTADMLNEISREVSHYLWLLEAHLQGPAEGQVWGGGQGRSLQADRR